MTSGEAEQRSDGGDADVVQGYRGKKILVTGGRGYVGAALTQCLSQVDCELILWDRSPQAAWWPSNATATVALYSEDVANGAAWTNALAGVDHVFHLAAFEHQHGSRQDPIRDLEVNAISALHLAEACRSGGLSPKIVFSSSANLYGRVAELPTNEGVSDDPLTLFAIHKQAAEHYLRLLVQEEGGQTVTLRLANVYGPTPRKDRMQQVVLNRMIARALAGESLSLYRNRDCIRDYVYLDDVAEALLLAGLIDDEEGENCFVIGSEQGHTIEEVVRLAGELADARHGGETVIQIDSSVVVGPAELRHFVADSSLFRRITGWAPRVGLRQGIEQTIEVML